MYVVSMHVRHMVQMHHCVGQIFETIKTRFGQSGIIFIVIVVIIVVVVVVVVVQVVVSHRILLV